MAEPLQITESVNVDAPPERVWDLVADVTRMGEWSPETTAAWWLGDASGPAVGARFKGRNRRGPVRWSTTCEITAADRGRQFSFVRMSRIDGGTEWTYTMQAEGDATVLTEAARQRRLPGPAARLAGRMTFGADREAQIREGLRTTIGRIKEAAESG